GCGEKVRVPGKRMLSRSSVGVLQSLGIDPIAAEARWEEESARSEGTTTDKKVWKCSRCSAPLNPDELKGAYVEGELVCSVCRAGLEERGEGRRPLKPEEIAILTAPNPERAKRQALLYGALFVVGFTLPLWVVVHLHFVVALLVGALVGLGGGWLVYRTRS